MKGVGALTDGYSWLPMTLGDFSGRWRPWLERWRSLPRGIRRIVAGFLGGTVVLVGLAMVVLPGPAVVVLPLGLAILASEYLWVRRWIVRFRQRFPLLRRINRRHRPAAASH